MRLSLLFFESLLALTSLIINNPSAARLIIDNKKAMLFDMATDQWGSGLKGVNKINHVLG